MRLRLESEFILNNYQKNTSKNESNFCTLGDVVNHMVNAVYEKDIKNIDWEKVKLTDLKIVEYKDDFNYCYNLNLN